MRISDWSSDVCSSDLVGRFVAATWITTIARPSEVWSGPGVRLWVRAGYAAEPATSQAAENYAISRALADWRRGWDSKQRYPSGYGAVRVRSEERREGKEWGSTCRIRGRRSQ